MSIRIVRFQTLRNGQFRLKLSINNDALTVDGFRIDPKITYVIPPTTVDRYGRPVAYVHLTPEAAQTILQLFRELIAPAKLAHEPDRTPSRPFSDVVEEDTREQAPALDSRQSN